MSLFETDRRDEKLPVFVLTGFLGSGKTTLLNRLLREPAVADSAVIVNEIGEVGLDHLLVERIDGQVALLRSGCICCAMRSDFEATLRELLARRDEGSLPPFARVVIETTGLADPAPLVQTVDSNPLVAHFCSLGAVLVTVDVVNAPQQLQRQWEARKQVALADELLLTKTDLAADTAPLEEVLRTLNPHANLRRIGAGPVPIDLLRPHAMQRDIDRAVGLLTGRALAPLHGDVVSFVVQAERPLDWPRLQQWLADLRTRHGDRLLRLKAIVSVAGEPDPLVLHGVHHLFHPPVRKPGLDWPAERSALVVIARGLDQALLEHGFAACAA